MSGTIPTVGFNWPVAVMMIGAIGGVPWIPGLVRRVMMVRLVVRVGWLMVRLVVRVSRLICLVVRMRRLVMHNLVAFVVAVGVCRRLRSLVVASSMVATLVMASVVMVVSAWLIVFAGASVGIAVALVLGSVVWAVVALILAFMARMPMIAGMVFLRIIEIFR